MRRIDKETESFGDDSMVHSAGRIRHQNSDPVLPQAAELEESGQLMPCLRPYKNGLLVKTNMWAKNEVEATMERYVAYQNAEGERRLRSQAEYDSSGSDELQYSIGSEEELEEIASLAEAIHSENESYNSGNEKYHLRHAHQESYGDKKVGKGKVGSWAPEAMLSPVEEPSDEYVDPMDELQCLVETVSEYLAEKEEEISKFGTLSKSKTTRTVAKDGTITETGENKKLTMKEELPIKSEALADGSQGVNVESMPDLTGVKNTMSSLFSSLTDKVGSGTKQLSTSVEKLVSNQPQENPEPSVQAESEISKLFSFIPKSSSTAPVTPISMAQDQPVQDRKFSLQSLLPFQSSDPKESGKKPEDSSQDAKLPGAPSSETSGLQSSSNISIIDEKVHDSSSMQEPASIMNSVFGKLNPLRFFSNKDPSSGEAGQTGALNKPHGQSDFKEEPLSSNAVQGSQTESGGNVASDAKSEGRNHQGNKMHLSISRSQTHSSDGEFLDEGDTVKITQGHTIQSRSSNLPSNQQGNERQCPPEAMSAQHNSERIDVHQENLKKDENKSSVTEAIKANSEESGFFSPLKKSFSQFMTSSSNEKPQNETLEGSSNFSFPLFRSSENVRQEKPLEDLSFSLGSKLKLPFFSSENISTPQQKDTPTEGGMLSGLLKFASSENLFTSKETPRQDPHKLPGSLSQPLQTGNTDPVMPRTISAMNLDVSKCISGVTQGLTNQGNVTDKEPKGSAETGWLSSLFKFASNEDVSVPPGQQSDKYTYPPEARPPNQNVKQQFDRQQPRGQHQLPLQQQIESGDPRRQEQFHKQHARHQQQLNSQLPPGQEQCNSHYDTEQQQEFHNQSHNRQQQLQQQVNWNSSIEHRQQQQDQQQITVDKEQKPAGQQGLFSGLFKFASSENVSTGNQPSAGHQHPQPPRQNQNLQHQSTVDQKPAGQPGILSSLFKFASSEDMSTGKPGESNPRAGGTEQKPSYARSQGLLTGIFSLGLNDNMSATKQEDAAGKKEGPLNFLKFMSKEEDPLPERNRDGQNNLGKTTFAPTDVKAAEKKEESTFSIFDYFIPKQRQETMNVSQIPTSSSTGSLRLQKSGSLHSQQNPPLSSSYSTGYIDRIDSYSQPNSQEHLPLSTSYSTEHISSWKQEQQAYQQISSVSSSQSIGHEPQCMNDHGHPRETVPYSSLQHTDHLLHITPDQQNYQQIQPFSSSQNAAHRPVNNYELQIFQETPSSHLEWHQQLNQYPISGIQTESQHVEEVQNYCMTGLEYRQPPDGATSMLETQQCWSPLERDPTHYYGSSQLGEEINDYQGQQSFYQAQSDHSTVYDMNWEHERRDFPAGYLQNDGKQPWNTDHDSLSNVYSQTGMGEPESWGDACDDALNLSVNVWDRGFSRRNSLPENRNCDLQRLPSYESFCPISYREDYYEEHETWDDHAFQGNSNYCQVPEPILKRSFEEVPVDLSYSSGGNANNWSYHDHQQAMDLEDELMYVDEVEWYQQWLSLLEQGMWWPSEDGDYGYYIYSDGEFIYSLLTDGTGQHVYVCTPETEEGGWGYGQYVDSFSSAWVENEMVAVCGFKVPLYNEDELFWFPEADLSEVELINSPLDLSAAFKKGDQLMNMNLETFSQMFEDSIYWQREEPLNFSNYRLQKVRMDLKEKQERDYLCEEPQTVAFDLTVNKIAGTQKREGLKEILTQKISVSLSSTSTSETGSSGLFGLFHSSHKHPDVKEEHAEDKTSSEEQSQPIKTISSFFSALGDLVGKAPASEASEISTASASTTTTTTSTTTARKLPEPARDGAFSLTSGMMRKEEPKLLSQDVPPIDQQLSNIFSTGFQSLKSKIMKEEPSVPTSVSTIPTSGLDSMFGLGSGQSEPPTLLAEKPKPVQPAQPSQVSQPVSEPADDSFFKNPLKLFNLSVTQPQAKPAEKPQGSGFLDFFKSAVGLEEQKSEPPKVLESQPKPAVKEAGATNTSANKESSGISSLFGSIGDLFKVDPPTTQQQPQQPQIIQQQPINITWNDMNKDPVGPMQNQASHQDKQEGLNGASPNKPGRGTGASSRPKGLRKQQTLGGIGESGAQEIGGKQLPNQPHGPGRSMSQNFPPNANISKVQDRSQTMPPGAPRPVPTGQNKQEPPPKQSGSLFNLPFGDILSGNSASKQDTPGKSIFSFFSGPSQPSHVQSPPAPPKQPGSESEGFKLPSFFSLGGATEENKPKSSGSSFSLFNMSFLDEKKPDGGQVESQANSGSLPRSVSNTPSRRSTKEDLDFMNSVLGISPPVASRTQHKREAIDSNLGVSATQVTHESAAAAETDLRNEQKMSSEEHVASPQNQSEQPQYSIPGAKVEVKEVKPAAFIDSENKPCIEQELSMQDQDSLFEDVSPVSATQSTEIDTVQVEVVQSDLVSFPQTFCFDQPEDLQNVFCQVEEPVSETITVETVLDVKEPVPSLDSAAPQPQTAVQPHPAVNLPTVVQPQLRPGEMIAPGLATVPETGAMPKPPEPEKSVVDSSVEMFSGFMSKVKLFSGGPSAPSKPSTGFFTAQPSMTRSPSPAPQQQQKTTFFNLPGSLPAESLKNELFGIFKFQGDQPLERAESKPAVPAEIQLPVPVPEVWVQEESSEKQDEKEQSMSSSLTEEQKLSVDADLQVPSSESVVDTEAEKNTFESLEIQISKESGQEHQAEQAEVDIALQTAQEDVALSTPAVSSEEAQYSEEPQVTLESSPSLPQVDGTQLEHAVVTGDSQGKGSDQSVPTIENGQKVASLSGQPSAEPPPSKSFFDMPGIPTPKFGFMSSTGDSGKSFGSFFSPPSIPKGSPQKDGGLLSGFKKFSVGFFEEEKTASKEEPAATSMFGKKLDFSFPWQKESAEPLKQEPPVVTSQPMAKEVKLLGASDAPDNCTVGTEHVASGSSKVSIEGKDLNGLGSDDHYSLDQSVAPSQDSFETREGTLVATIKDSFPDSSVEPQVEISPPDLQSELLAEHEKDPLSEPLPSAELSPGLQQDGLTGKDLLNVKRPVAA
ncbi:uncharacterized protein LOC131697452 [Acipenser ruthenus]|uniref:uncharacterized protein LOC131697452 n=1 Tax=Acipenser ruthenus TaxID=7906 RepID=UPI00274226A6|nr:uncharacterized protein LOC131697452 [Acipenser ruthenus]